MKKILTTISMMAFLAVTVVAQSGGGFSITQSVVSNGGGTSANGSFEITGTMAQTVTATSAGASFEARSGFWQQDFAPTSAGVTLAGRVRTADGRGLRGAIVMVIDQTGVIRTSRTSSFGNYQIDGFTAGLTVTVSIISKRFRFMPRTIELTDNLNDFDFTALEADNF